MKHGWNAGGSLRSTANASSHKAGSPVHSGTRSFASQAQDWYGRTSLLGTTSWMVTSRSASAPMDRMPMRSTSTRPGSRVIRWAG